MIESKTNKIKYVLLTVLSAIFVVVALLFVNISSLVVYAESMDVRNQYYSYSPSELAEQNTNYYRDVTLTNTLNNNTLADDIYSWTSGASVMKNDIAKIIFRFELLNANYETSSMWSSFTFDLYKCNNDGTSGTAIMSIKIRATYLNGQNQIGVGIKRNTYTDIKYGISNYNNVIASDSDQDYIASFTSNQTLVNDFVSNGYSMVSFFTLDSEHLNSQLRFSGDVRQYMYFVVGVSEEDYYSNFFISSSYAFENKQSRIDSSVVSLYSILNKMNAMGELNTLDSGLLPTADAIISNGTLKQVQVSYLTQIGDTPFAEKKTAYVTVPVIQGNIRPADVCEALDLDTLAVMQSPCQYFTYDSSNEIYNAYYLQSVWLSSKDANGHSQNYFLDINRSYRTYYYNFVSDGIFSNGLYNWFWSQMINKYPAIAPYMDYELYGYFGYSVVPDTYTVSQLFYEMFDGSPNYDGIVEHFMYNERLDYNSYMKLLDDYDYGWLAKAWNTVAGFVSGSTYSASHYLFYVDGETTEAMIAENGADDINDNNSHLWNTTEDVVDDVLDTFGNLFDKYGDVFKVIFGVMGVFFVIFLFLILSTRFFKMKAAVNNYKSSERTRKRRKK